MEEFAPGLKSIDDALEIRRRVLLAFEAAERTTDPAEQSALLTFVVIGAGPTGVELAGALPRSRGRPGARLRHIKPASARIVLLEGRERVLPPYRPSCPRKRPAARGLGVE